MHNVYRRMGRNNSKGMNDKKNHAFEPLSQYLYRYVNASGLLQTYMHKFDYKASHHFATKF